MPDIAVKLTKTHDDMGSEEVTFPPFRAIQVDDNWYVLGTYDHKSDEMAGNQVTIINNQTTIINNQATIINLLGDIKAKLDVGINVKIVTSL